MGNADEGKIGLVEEDRYYEGNRLVFGESGVDKGEQNDEEEEKEIPIDQALVISLHQTEETQVYRPGAANVKETGSEGHNSENGWFKEVEELGSFKALAVVGPFDIDDEKGYGDGEDCVGE
jgi:hypothetical protein